MSEYDICVWDIQFCKKDEDGNELLNNDGTVKLFQLKTEHDVSFIAEGTEHEDLEEVSDEQGYEIPYTGGDSALSPDDLQEGA